MKVLLSNSDLKPDRPGELVPPGLAVDHIVLRHHLPSLPALTVQITPELGQVFKCKTKSETLTWLRWVVILNDGRI